MIEDRDKAEGEKEPSNNLSVLTWHCMAREMTNVQVRMTLNF